MNRVLFVIDIDGTIADASRRFEEAGPEPDRSNREVYDAWVAKVQNADSLLEDKPVPGMNLLCHAVDRLAPHVFTYLTSREERWRAVTEQWLDEKGFPIYNTSLLMRANGDYTEGCEFKETVIKNLKFRSGAEEIVVIDDDGRGDLEPICKKHGWTFLKARSGGQK